MNIVKFKLGQQENVLRSPELKWREQESAIGNLEERISAFFLDYKVPTA